MKQNPFLNVNEVAKLFRVSSRTVGRWSREGKLKHIKTPGGYRRYLIEDVRELLKDEQA